MKKSKVDRVADVFRRAFRDSITYQQAVEGCNGNHSTVKELQRLEEAIIGRAIGSVQSDPYRRLEVSDIIRGHKRAWPES